MSDLIRREDAIKAIAEVLSLNRFSSFKDIKNFDKFAERMLRNVPSADRPQGEWIESNLIKDGRIFICSNCNMAWVSKKRTMDGMNYCPNCGARMKGADDE